MVAIKSHEAARFLKAPDRSISAVLTYGTDAGLVTERARAAAKAWAGLEDPPSEITRLDDADLETDPDRLSVELMTVPMFGGRKIVLSSTGRRINAVLLKELIEPGPLPGVLIVEAGNLKPTDKIRSLFEKAKHAAAIACFPDEGRDLAVLVDEEVKAAKMTIAPEAREVLLAQLGADRVLSRGEIAKLVLYCSGRKRIELDDVEAIVSDASELGVDRIVDAAAGGEPGVAVRELSRALNSGESPQTVIIALQRHFMRLHRIQADVTSGRSIADAMKALRPPLHFKQKNAVTAQVRKWPMAHLDRALAEIAKAARNARQTGCRDDLITESLILGLAQLARIAR
ncbi:MAG: DNA polymerase III subunit delta [Alphaproteobacteria bacterium BRH_c36]|nr:MAG: DNA polymerase III subunit delta [Alphaproteobacteria bacterium BRH_c36]